MIKLLLQKVLMVKILNLRKNSPKKFPISRSKRYHFHNGELK